MEPSRGFAVLSAFLPRQGETRARGYLPKLIAMLLRTFFRTKAPRASGIHFAAPAAVSLSLHAYPTSFSQTWL